MRRGVPILLLVVCACRGSTPAGPPDPAPEEVPAPPVAAPPAAPAAPEEPCFVVRVATTYPGADAESTDGHVGYSLQHFLRGVDGAERVASDCRNDGTCTVTVHFGPKADRDAAVARVQEAANKAAPMFPDEVRRQGMTVRKLPASPPPFWLALTSPDGTHDAAFLSNYATLRLRDELARVPGVADVTVHGVGDDAVRVWVDPDRLAARGFTAADVVGAIRQQNVAVAAGQVGQPPKPPGEPFSLLVHPTGRLTDPKQFEEIVLKADADGKVVRLRDVARVERAAAARSSSAAVNGRPAALVAVTAWPGRVTAADLRQKVATVAPTLPAGVRLDLVVDRATDRLAVVEVLLPERASREQTDEVVRNGCEAVRVLPGTPDSLTVADEGRPNAATVLVRLPAHGGPPVADVRRALNSPPGAVFRVSDVPPGRDAFPVRVAVIDTRDRRAKEPFGFPDKLPVRPGAPVPQADAGQEHVALADRIAADINKAGAAVDAVAFPVRTVPQLVVDIDREKCAAVGVPVADVATALQVNLGALHVQIARPHELRVLGPARPPVDDLTRLKVRGRDGTMIPLGAVVSVHAVDKPPAVVRVDGRRAVVITADPPAGKSVAEAAAAVRRLAADGVPQGFEVKDLSGPPH